MFRTTQKLSGSGPTELLLGDYCELPTDRESAEEARYREGLGRIWDGVDQAWSSRGPWHDVSSVLFILFLILPLALALVFVILLIRGERNGLPISAVAFCLTVAAGYWSIAQSRASTAGIGILFLPGFGAVGALFAWLFGKFRVHPRAPVRAVAWLCLLASLALPIMLVFGGFRENDKNRERDRMQAENFRKIEENRAAIRRLLAENREHEAAALEAEIQKHRNDRTFLIPALETTVVSEATLDQLSRSSDLGVVLEVARNQQTRSETLDWIYRRSSYPPYFFQALAENKNTNVEILRKLFEHPEPQGPLGSSLGRNPATPRDILEKLADSGDIWTLQGLLKNPALDCELLRKVRKSLERSKHLEDYRASIAALEPRLCPPK